jgi:hypothetical protein
LYRKGAKKATDPLKIQSGYRDDGWHDHHPQITGLTKNVHREPGQRSYEQPEYEDSVLRAVGRAASKGIGSATITPAEG